jgi:hypothetical protein
MALATHETLRSRISALKRAAQQAATILLSRTFGFILFKIEPIKLT